MDLPTIVSFYTIGTPYETEALRLKQSCERLQTPFIIEGLESTGDWIRNCSLKAAFVLRHLQQLKRPLLWVDADAEILLPLDYFRGAEFDVACYVQWSISGLPPTMDRREMPVMSGTVYLNYTPGGVRIAEIWAAYCANTPEVWDQDLLDEDEAGRFGREDIAVHVSRWAFVRIHVFGEEGKQPEQLTAEEVADVFD